MNIDIFLIGDLADHRRGTVMADIFPVKTLPVGNDLPECGSLIMFGQYWQLLTEEQQNIYSKWLKLPGRQVLLVPPFREGSVSYALNWQVKHATFSAPNGEGLAASLCDEVKYVFDAVSCQFDRSLGHSWQAGEFNTLFSKLHATSGQFAITSLPLWSLTCLDDVSLINEWFSSLFNFAGTPKITDIVLSSDKHELILLAPHYVLLCCAYGKSLKDGIHLKERIKRLGVFNVDDEQLSKALTDLENNQLFVDGCLTQKAEAKLMASPYKIYADELVRMTP